MLKKLILTTLRRIPGIKNYLTTYPPGHFYSPIPSLEEIKLQEDKLFDKNRSEIPGIELNIDFQLDLLERFKPFFKEFPFLNKRKQEGWNFSLGNGYFGFNDAIILFGMIRFFKPKRIIEIGSGFSSALMVDINKHFFNNKILFQFIEPFPDRVNALLDTEHQEKYVISKRIQEVDFEELLLLEKGDFLFIDSSHVSKTGSDLNYILFEIIPKLPAGVIIHFHDIFFPFEYPKKWVTEWFKGFAWNEIYLIRALLMGSSVFEIQLFNSMIEEKYSLILSDSIGSLEPNIKGGGSLWIKKIV